MDLRQDQAKDTLANLQFLWSRPVHLQTVVEGKPTTLLAIATARATGVEAAQLARVGASELGDDEVAAIQLVLQTTGSREELETQISALADEAIAALDCVPFIEEARVALTELARFVVRRTA